MGISALQKQKNQALTGGLLVISQKLRTLRVGEESYARLLLTGQPLLQSCWYGTSFSVLHLPNTQKIELVTPIFVSSELLELEHIL